MTWLVMLAGAFSLQLGAWHLGVLRWFDIRMAIGPDAPGRPPIRPFVVGPFRHGTTRADIVGVVAVMNAAASYVLVSIGVFGLMAPVWVGTPGGRWLALWVAGWWTLRAALQVPMGRRPIDVAAIVLFSSLAAVFVLAALA